jgi:Putative DNA-binding domain
MNLAELQRAFQQHVLQGSGTVEREIHGSDAVPVAARLTVYSDAYRLRLVDALAQNYPRLQRLLGDSAFAELAREYLAAFPSTHESVRWFGDRLAEHLAAKAEAGEQPWLQELARWEWSVAAAFDSQDLAPLDETALAKIEPDHWPALRFQFHPSLQLLQLTTNTPALFKALSDDAALPPPVCLETPQSWVIWRQQLTPRYRSLSADEASALRTALGSGSFEAICDALCEWHDAADVPVRAAVLLKTWLGEEMLSGTGPAA